MKCLICGGESSGEVCSKCIRLEKIMYQKEWEYKEGMLIKKIEKLRIAISNLRISGRVYMSDNEKGLNGRIDNISHYLLNIKACETVTYQNKPSYRITIKNDATGFTRYLFLLGFEEENALAKSLEEAKEKAQRLTESIQQKGTVFKDAAAAGTATDDIDVVEIKATPTPAMPKPASIAAPKPAAPTPAPAPKPAAAESVGYDTVALSNIADDITEFETKIKKLKVLRDNGILSPEEYEAEKKKLVSIF